MIVQIQDANRRAAIAREILGKLPDWFGIPESTAEYVRGCENLPLWADFEGETCRGFIALRQTSDCAGEIYVMGVAPEFHRLGIGSGLFRALHAAAKDMGLAYLHVKTVRMGMYPEYDITNGFYRSLGFRELECIPDLWDAQNPCQLYIMNV